MFIKSKNNNYHEEKDYVSMWDVNVNLHYLFNVAEKFLLHPLAGAGLVGMKADLGSLGSTSETKFGFNVGAGTQYWLIETFGLNLDIKYQYVSDFDRLVFSLGGVYQF